VYSTQSGELERLRTMSSMCVFRDFTAKIIAGCFSRGGFEGDEGIE
jgi:hypothetical protein